MVSPPDTSAIVNYHTEPTRIPFRDVDGWGLVWHGHYFSYVDAARVALLKMFAIPLQRISTPWLRDADRALRYRDQVAFRG